MRCLKVNAAVAMGDDHAAAALGSVEQFRQEKKRNLSSALEWVLKDPAVNIDLLTIVLKPQVSMMQKQLLQSGEKWDEVESVNLVNVEKEHAARGACLDGLVA